MAACAARLINIRGSHDEREAHAVFCDIDIDGDLVVLALGIERQKAEGSGIGGVVFIDDPVETGAVHHRGPLVSDRDPHDAVGDGGFQRSALVGSENIVAVASFRHGAVNKACALDIGMRRKIGIDPEPRLSVGSRHRLIDQRIIFHSRNGKPIFRGGLGRARVVLPSDGQNRVVALSRPVEADGDIEIVRPVGVERTVAHEKLQRHLLIAFCQIVFVVGNQPHGKGRAAHGRSIAFGGRRARVEICLLPRRAVREYPPPKPR